MKNKKIWELRNLRDQITGTSPVKNLFLTLHSTDNGQEYCVVKLTFQRESNLGYIVSCFQSMENGKVFEIISESINFQNPQYENEFDYNNGFKTSYLIPLKDALPYLNMKNYAYIHNSKIKEIKNKYNEIFGITKSNNQQMVIN